MVVPTYNEAENLEWIVGRLRAAAARRRRARRRRRLARRHRRDRRPLAAADAAGPVLHRTEKAGLGAAYLPASRSRSSRLRRDRRDGRRRLPPARAAAPAARRRSHDADLVIGSRWVPGGSVVNWPCPREALSRGGNLYVRLLLGIPVRDATAGFRLFRRDDAGEDRPRRRCGPPATASRPTWPTAPCRPGCASSEVPIEFVERGARRVQDEPGGRQRVAAADHPVGAARAPRPAAAGQGAGMTAPTPRQAGPRRRRRWVRLAARRRCSSSCRWWRSTCSSRSARSSAPGGRSCC